ncbi:hypothetical protein A1359_19060 [Methylomonas lenta]|uniref:Uncharacterized protein n=1 Tax=Methylomonas lenta TaxID=980561 RepID=A0A177NX52_9GAMM|nr:hypothetical protein [Methylomonas lenta]OAI21759.1 hypothetical protein A1359_19060 [Methylomonas lenta]
MQFSLVLVEPDTKIVKGLHMVVTVSPNFRSRLVKLIQKQAAEPFDTLAAHYRAIGRLSTGN